MVKGLKIKVRKVWEPILTFVEDTGEELVGGRLRGGGGGEALAPPLILNRGLFERADVAFLTEQCCFNAKSKSRRLQRF